MRTQSSSQQYFYESNPPKEIGKRIEHLWSLVYPSPPDYLVADQGLTYTSKNMKVSLETFGISLDEASIERLVLLELLSVPCTVTDSI